MTETVNDFDCNERKTSSDSSEPSMSYSKMAEEESKLLLQNEEIEAKEKEIYYSQASTSGVSEYIITEEDWMAAREAEMKERRYKKLLHLLNNSKMYSLILKKKLKEELKESKIFGNVNKTNKRSHQSKLRKQNYKLGNIITEEGIDENALKGESKLNMQIEDEDYFKETRVTKLGFEVSYKQPLLLEGARMRDYQLKGCEWLKILFTNGVNGILADEMGLGKTIQVISFICYMIEKDIQGPFLIVAPLSTVSNWMLEFKRFAPKIPTLLYHGTEEERKNLLPKIFEKTPVLNKMVNKVVITSYNVPLRDKTALGKINWYYLIVDEGHRIKNHNSRLSRTLRQFITVGRLLLTGTPLQNDLSELWSLLNFLLPEIFNDLDVFESWFDIKELESNGSKFMAEKFNINVVTTLQEILTPFLLRREKKDVDLQLPPKKEILIYCRMTPQQKKMYESVLDRSIEFLLKPKENVDVLKPSHKRRCFLNSPYGKKNSEDFPSSEIQDFDEIKEEQERFVTNLAIKNPQMQLRKIVNHPYLIQYPLITGTEMLRIDEDLVKESGKMQVLDALLTKLKARGHKVIVFSYFATVLDLLEDYADFRKFSYCRLDGQLKINQRDEEITNFMNNPEIFIFFITMRSGGLGINLTAADTVIFYDSDWNPQINLQSQDRCHRIGQTKPVIIYRLCMKGTIDEKIIERGNAKRRLEKMIIQEGKFTLNAKRSGTLNLKDVEELKLLLGSTDHDSTINANGFVLNDDELDALLDRSEMAQEDAPEKQSDTIS